jgi:hypothetical protein
MKRAARFLLAATALALAFPASAANVPTRVEIKYRVLLGSLSIGEGYDVFEHNGKS